ncbi:hypothetical protein SAMN05216389_11140 [Oceanobacillus limi]|uniref:Uncharacterized protein n=1 Tax=Oceanobacillus limi TaxID=930131 RepID=A0A1I0ED62_9BACI|nr:hypothetical protein [Oceanobacillus limi]SET42866.1 hypothetical protein SAMN05216389_11140 [Oceanobacillus limi]
MKSQLNSLADLYRSNPTEELFTRIYTEAMTSYRENAETVAKHNGIDKFDLLAGYDDVFMNCLDSFKDNFEHLLSRSLKIKRLELRRNRATKEKYETHIINSEGESDAATLDYLLLKQDRVEDGDHTEHITKSDELIELIKSLINPDKIKDPLTTAIVNEVLKDETIGKFRPTAIAKKLNVHHSKVTRKLAQLKHNYDSARFGDYRDYLCG